MDSIAHSINSRLPALLALALTACAMEVAEEIPEDTPGSEDGGSAAAGPGEVEVREEALSATTAYYWRSLTQAERDLLVLQRAKKDREVSVGKNCKLWVQQNVVPQASFGVASVPTTADGGYGWYWEYGPYAERIFTTIRGVRPGWIVQMRIPSASGTPGPHTSIVYAVNSSGVWWIESNFFGDGTVHLRFQSYDDFLAKTYRNGRYEYSIYRISGG